MRWSVMFACKCCTFLSDNWICESNGQTTTANSNDNNNSRSSFCNNNKKKGSHEKQFCETKKWKWKKQRKNDRKSDCSIFCGLMERRSRKIDEWAGRQTGREADIQAERRKGNDIQTDWNTGRQRDKQTYRWLDRHTVRETDKQYGRQTKIPTYRQTYRPTERQTGGETVRQ